jgi:hypothetical protein
MTFVITEVQDKKVTRTYNITGPKLETVQGFWDYLKASKQIESFEIK